MAARVVRAVSAVVLLATALPCSGQTVRAIRPSDWTAAKKRIAAALEKGPNYREVARLGQSLASDPDFGELVTQLSQDGARTFSTVMRMDGKASEEYARRVAAELEALQLDKSTAKKVVDAVGMPQQTLTAHEEVAARLSRKYELVELEKEKVRRAVLYALTHGDGQRWEVAFGKVLAMEYTLHVTDEDHEFTDQACLTDCQVVAAIEYANIMSAWLAGMVACTATGPGSVFCIAGVLATVGYSVAMMNKHINDCVAVCEGLTEEEGYCGDDGDCAQGEWCDRGTVLGIGRNECKTLKTLGQTCTRNGQCASSCCKPHIGSGFVPVCRPPDRCN